MEECRIGHCLPFAMFWKEWRQNMESFIEVDTSAIEPAKAGNDLFENRASLARMQQQSGAADVSIIVVGYNRLDKTKRCVESILKYTQTIDYELWLIDNGSSDGTLDYFQSVPYRNKKIIRISKNIGAGYPGFLHKISELGTFICIVANDIIVTPHWLENMLICMKSDPKIGMISPVSSNVSNLQDPGIAYQSYEEMLEKAERFNHSDPRKWEDRCRLITLGTLYRKEMILAAGWPLGDGGFFHDFMDDDTSFTVRRLGYRTVLAGDTWICHDHDIRHGEGKDPVQFQKSLDIGRANFREKYLGLDAWDDVNNYYIPFLGAFPPPRITGTARVLGVDVRCGTPILDVKNWLRKFSIFDTELSAFTQDPKYWADLKRFCGGPVQCDREEFLTDAFLKEYFDYVIADRPLNQYHEPQKMINDLFSLCKKGGVVVCKLRNTHSFLAFIHLLGQRDVFDQEFSYNLPLEAVEPVLSRFGAVQKIFAIPYEMDGEQQKALSALLPAEIPSEQRNDVIGRMLCREYLIIVKKE